MQSELNSNCSIYFNLFSSKSLKSETIHRGAPINDIIENFVLDTQIMILSKFATIKQVVLGFANNRMPRTH
ncbi:hypothetical protein BpHYR1_008694 [Brachionus plicatilis]|uniref:Uncharacterized protein n=1 Tax=Brachionus plicatilis TaxID=10195 RepID=A0A3M7RIE6_BRAPC|nr:hypothetical protein BpHYR1_008694 [Brachionus plicatilis]